MASLRKKPDVAVETLTDPPAMAANLETLPPSPAPELASQTDAASEALRSQLEALKQAETTQQQAAVAILAATERRNAWVKSNPLAQQHYNTLNSLHGEALQAGFADTSPQYFQFIEDRLNALNALQPAAATHMADEMHQRAAQARAPEPPPPAPRSNGSFVSAPVSREVPSANGKRPSGKVTLTREEQDMARVSGVSLEEYARQKARLTEMRESGAYRDQEQR